MALTWRIIYALVVIIHIRLGKLFNDEMKTLDQFRTEEVERATSKTDIWPNIYTKRCTGIEEF